MSDIEDILYDEEPDIIYCIGSKAYLLANKYAPKTPIVFSSIINWLRLPMKETTYGVSNELHAGMEIMLFRYIFPELQTIGVLYSATYTEEWVLHARKTAQEMGVDIVGQKISKQRQVLPALKKVLPQVDAFWLISDPELMSAKEELLNILQECDRQKVPVLSYHETFANFGATLTVSADNPTIGRQVASIVTELIAGNVFPYRPIINVFDLQQEIMRIHPSSLIDCSNIDQPDSDILVLRCSAQNPEFVIEIQERSIS